MKIIYMVGYDSKLIIIKNSMEKAMQINAYDSSSQSSSSKKKKEKEQEKISLLYQLDWFPITTSSWVASMAFLCNLLFIVHFMDFYSQNSKKVFQNANGLILISGFITSKIASVAIVLNLLLSILSLLALFFNRNQSQGYKYILGWIGSKLFPALRYLIQLNLAIAAWFLIRSPPIAAFFILAAMVNIFVNFFAQNYTLRKDYLCCKSMEFLMLLKAVIIIAYAVSCAGYYLITIYPSTLLIFCIIHFILAFTLFICFFLFGYLTYRHTASQVSLIIIINLYFGFAIGNLYNCAVTMFTDKFVNNQNIISAGCFFICLNLLSYALWSKLKRYGSDKSNLNYHKKIFYIFQKLQNSSESINDDCQIRGIIRYHLSNPCTNPQCFTQRPDGDYYDAKKNKNCFSNKLNQGKTSFVKFIIKCIYEQELDLVRWDETDLLLQYIQFYYMKLKNLFQVCLLLVELQKKFLTPFQKLRLTRLRRVMMEQNRKINQQIYEGNLDIENLIISEQKFDQIRFQLNQVLMNNLNFWNYISNDCVNLSAMAKIVKPNLKLIDKINMNWKSIAKYFEIQKVWKFYFACYTLYIKNQKLKPQFLECFGQSVHQDEIFLMESQHIDKTTDSDKLYIARMIFEQDSCCIHVDNNQNKPIIKTVSRYFERNYGYQSHQIMQSSLDILMLPCFRSFHARKFLQWAGQGKSNNQNTYQVKKVFPRDCNAYIVPSFKFYKQYLCNNKQLQYVAMLKKNKEEENIIILNDDYEIQGMTRSLAKRLQLFQNDYDKIIGLNLLIFMSQLIYFTKFQEDKTHLDEENPKLSEENNHKPHRYMHSFSQNPRSGNSSRRNYSNKKQFTKNNMTLCFPMNFQTVKNIYQISKGGQSEKAKIFDAIIKTHKIMKEEGEEISFKVELELRHVKIYQQFSYIQLYLREIQNVKKKRKSGDMLPEPQMMLQDKVLENHQDNEVNSQEFQKFFQSSQSSQNISLSFTDNIFIKEQNNQSVEMISHVKSISVSVRIIFVFFSLLLLISLLLEYQSYWNYEDNAMMLQSFVLYHLKSLILNNNYHSQVLGLSESSGQIGQLTLEFTQVRNRFPLKLSMINKEINEPRRYSRYGMDASYSFDQIDLPDRIFEQVVTIWYSYNGEIDATNSNFLQYEKLVIPGLHSLSVNAELKIHERFDKIFANTKIKNTIYIILQVLLLVVGFILVFSSLIRITRSFICLMEIFTHFGTPDLKRIIKYCQYLTYVFNHLGQKYDLFKVPYSQEKNYKLAMEEKSNGGYGSNSNQSMQKNKSGINASSMRHHHNDEATNSRLQLGMTGFSSQMQAMGMGLNSNINDEQKIDNDNANLNKKVKKVENGRDLTNLKIKSIVFLVIFLLVFGISSFGLNLYIDLVNEEINNFENVGYQIFTYYSVTNIQMLSIKDRAINRQNFMPQRFAVYKPKVQQMKKLKKQTAVSMKQDFVVLKDSIMFDNFCTKYPQVLKNEGFTTQDCLNVGENNLQHGVQSYLFYLDNYAEIYMKSSSYELNAQIMDDLEDGLELTNIFLQHLVVFWADSYMSALQKLKRNIIIICSCLIVFQIIIYFWLIQVLIVGNLKDNFIFFRKIYEGLMPDFIVTKEKIIKAKLEVEGIIKK